MSTTVINVSTLKEIPTENFVYIGRANNRGKHKFPESKWKNPFVEDKDGTRAEVIAKYREWIQTQPELMAALPELKGKVLGCYCKPKTCHGDVLVEMVDSLTNHNGVNLENDSTMKITIDEEFKSLIPPLSDEERMQLMDNLQREGCRDPLVVWKGTGILIDGHNRFEICERENIDYNVHEIGFESREKALDWIYRNQLGRRNLSPADASELRGRMYNGRKKQNGQRGKEKLHQNEEAFSTAEIVAKETGVSKATIERDGKYAEAVEKVAKEDPEIRAKVRSGKVKKSEVISKSKPTESKPAKSKPAKSKPAKSNAAEPEADEPPDLLVMFVDIKSMIRTAFAAIPDSDRVSMWRQLVEQLNTEYFDK